jgi:hypothetical protein
MRKILYVSLILMACSFTDSCNLDCKDGSGNVVSEKRAVEPFTSIEFNGCGNIFISRNHNPELEIKADDNLLLYIETSVSGDKLKIDELKCFGKFQKLDYYISIDKIEKLVLNGSGTIESKDTFRTDKTKIILNGSGEVDIILVSGEVISDLSGSGQIILSGKAGRHRIVLSGSGEFNLFGFITSETDIELSGSGRCQVFAEDILRASLSGSGDVEYKGGPKKRNIETKGTGVIKEVQ